MFTSALKMFLNSSVVTAVTDAYFNLVTLLLPGNGTNGAQNNTFLDSSTNNFTITRNGNTTQGTFSPFSQTGWSVFLDGSGDYFTADASTLGGASVSTFTIDGWIFPTTFANIIYVIGDMQPTGGTNYLSVNIETSGAVTLYWFDGAVKSCTSTGTLTLNQWNYFAIRVSSNAITIYANSATAGQTGTTTLTSRTGTSNFAIGAFNGSATPNAYLSNLRVSTVARTISIPTSAFSNDADTRFLLFQSNRFINNGSTLATLTPFGNTSVQAFSPFAPTAAYSTTDVGGSGYFDGTGDYLSIANQTALQFGTGDFCYETWIYPTNLQANKAAGERCTIDTGSSGFLISLWKENVHLASYGVTDLADFASTEIAINTWAHLAITRSGTSVRCFVNGTQAGNTTTLSTNFSSSGSTFIGQFNNSTSLFQGYMCGTRLVKGSAVYTSNFTCPTAPPTAITNTSLLLNFTNAGITDATAKNVLETVGNASISTAQSKFGGSSMLFDGTGDYLSATPKIQSNAVQGGNATIEMWVYTSNSSPSLKCLVDTRSAQNTDTGFGVYQISNNVVIYGAGVKGNAVGQLTGNTWVHVAVTRANTTNYVFINGTLYNTFSYGNTLTSSNVTIGSDVAGSNAFTGYIDDLRITNGFARYTANFTPTTVAFPLQ